MNSCLSFPPRLLGLFRLLFLCVLLHSCRGHYNLISSRQPIVARVGDDVMLPCHLEPVMDVAAKTLEWTRPDLNYIYVLVWRSGQELVKMKHPSYTGRSSLFTDGLKHGNISLKLSKVTLSDKGTYKCLIPDLRSESVVQLVVASDAAAPLFVTLSGTDRDSGELVLQCESKGWYPEPEVLWLDGEGHVLSAGPTETVPGPDDLYTVSSRVTVDKRHGNRFTCRIQQTNINQTRETHVHVSDDLFKVPSSFSATTVGLIVGLALCVMLILLLVFFLWRKEKVSKRNKQDSTKGNVETKTNDVEENVDDTNNQLQEAEDKRNVKEKTNKVEKLLADKKNLEGEKNKLETDLKQKNTESKQLSEDKTKLEDKVKDMETRNTQLSEEKRKFEDKVKDLEKKITELEKQLQEEKLNGKQREEDLKKELLDEIQRRKETEEQLNVKLKEKTKELLEKLSEEKNQHEASVNALNAKLETTKQQLEKQLQEKKLNGKQREEDLKKKLLDEIQRRKEAEKQLNNKTTEVQTLLTEKNRLEDKVKKLEKDVETKQKEVKPLSDEKKKLEDKVKKLEEIKETTGS